MVKTKENRVNLFGAIVSVLGPRTDVNEKLSCHSNHSTLHQQKWAAQLNSYVFVFGRSLGWLVLLCQNIIPRKQSGRDDSILSELFH